MKFDSFGLTLLMVDSFRTILVERIVLVTLLTMMRNDLGVLVRLMVVAVLPTITSSPKLRVLVGQTHDVDNDTFD